MDNIKASQGKINESHILMPKSILITGGTGFIGRRLLHYLTADNENANETLIYAVVRPGQSIDIPAILCPWDLRDPMPLDSFPMQVEAVVHLAADRRRSDSSVSNLSRQIRINVDATSRLYDWARLSGVKRIIHISTTSVVQAGPMRTMLNEQSPLVAAPAHPYALTKRWSEEIALEMREHIESVHILRPTQVYGPGQGIEGALKKIARRLQHGKTFHLPMPDGDYLNPVFITDVLDMIIQLLRTPGCETFVIGGPDVISERRIINDIAQCLGVAGKIEPNPKLTPHTRAFSSDALDTHFPQRRQTSWVEGVMETSWGALSPQI